MNKIIFYAIFIFISQSIVGQNKTSYTEKSEVKIDYCEKLKIVKKLIGQKVKIRHNGGVYSTLNGSDLIEWPNDEIKKIAGKEFWGDFEPQIGDIGEIIYITKSKYNEIIYLLEIKNYYVPVECSYLTHPSQLDDNEKTKKVWDEIYAYGEGDCNFKKYGFNNTWNRAGIVKIDKLAESYACGLKTKGVDTLMLVKRIYDNGSSPNEKQYVLWKENRYGYLKTFENNERNEPTQTEAEKFNWNDFINFYEQNNVSLENKKPKSVVSHWTNLIVQFYNGLEYYSFGMQLLCREEDEKLANVRFIRLIDQKLK